MIHEDRRKLAEASAGRNSIIREIQNKRGEHNFEIYRRITAEHSVEDRFGSAIRSLVLNESVCCCLNNLSGVVTKVSDCVQFIGDSLAARRIQSPNNSANSRTCLVRQVRWPPGISCTSTFRATVRQPSVGSLPVSRAHSLGENIVTLPE